MVDSTLKVTTNFSLTTDAKGNVNVAASSTVENVSGHQYSTGQLAAMGNDIGAVQQSVVMMGFGANTTQMMTAVGASETAFGTARVTIQSPRYQSASANRDVFDYFGRKVDFDPIPTYRGYTDGSVPTMSNFTSTYNSGSET